MRENESLGCLLNINEKYKDQTRNYTPKIPGISIATIVLITVPPKRHFSFLSTQLKIDKAHEK